MKSPSSGVTSGLCGSSSSASMSLMALRFISITLSLPSPAMPLVLFLLARLLASGVPRGTRRSRRPWRPLGRRRLPPGLPHPVQHRQAPPPFDVVEPPFLPLVPFLLLDHLRRPGRFQVERQQLAAVPLDRLAHVLLVVGIKPQTLGRPRRRHVELLHVDRQPRGGRRH